MENACVLELDEPTVVRFASLWYHPEKGIVHHQVKQRTSGEQFQNC